FPTPLYNVGELLNVGFDVQDLFVQVTVVIHLKSTLPRQINDQRRQREDRSRELGRGHHSRRPRKRNCDSMMCSSSCARSNPARPLLGLLLWSLSIRRSAAATRSRARSKSATVYCRGPGRVRFPRCPFDALRATMAALSCFAGAIWPLRFSKRTASIKTYSVRLRLSKPAD